MTLKTEALIAAGLLAVLGGVFAAGRYSAPKPDVRVTEHVVYQDRVVEKVVTVTAKADTKTVVVYRDRTVKPDGTVHEQSEERTVDAATETAHTDDAKAETSQTDTQRTITITAAKPQWRVSLLAGASLRSPLLPVYGPLVLGVEVNRRLLGPLWVGLWAQTGGSGGISLGIEF